jgi:Fe-S cluster assembly scaffold protein SufB
VANPQNFLDNLKNLRIVMSVALEHTRDNLDEFTTNGTLYEVRQAERSVTKIRILAAQLEKEFDVLEISISEAPSSSRAARK